MILGISGKRGAGKTLAAIYLVKNHKWTKVSFAEDLKTISKTLMPFTDNDLNVPAKKEAKYKHYDWTPRDFLINLGEFMRYHDNGYWLNRALAKCVNPKLDYVFDDVRYRNEAELIKEKGGKLIRINRYEKLNIYGKNLDIPSETDLDDYDKFDYVIHEVRNTTQTELYRQMDAFLSN